MQWLAACLWLTAAMLVVTIGLAGYAFVRSGRIGVTSAIAAGSVNWLAALMALSIVARLRGGPWVIHGVMAGTLFRVGIPLFVGILLTRTAGPLANAGVFGMIVVCYLVGLVVDTLLALRLIRPPREKLTRAV